MSNSYKDTLNLPTTEFSIRANAKETEAALKARWAEQKLDKLSYTHNEGKEKFLLHDGPPYANGHIHLGHALNKILKDSFTKYFRMQGMHVPVRPGWDCHGLPIEHKVTSEMGLRPDEVDPKQLKKKCREFAQGWIDTQQGEFKELGVLADWDNLYYTMDPAYEADILRAFSSFVDQGFIERKGKTVPWCPSCQTVLASAEIEHKERKDPSIYILFPLPGDVTKAAFPDLAQEVNLLVWTTTPWTIPLNRAVVLNPTAKYVVLQGADGKLFAVGAELADKICEMLAIEKNVVAKFDAKLLEGKQVLHPILETPVPILLDPMVLTTDGTAFLHSAPGCGPEDYFLGVKNGLEIFSPLSPDGKYTEGILPTELEGMPVTDGQIWVIKALHANGRLLYKKSIRHAYPHCWRCHGGLIFRATDQWFCNLQNNNLVTQALAEIEKIQFVPDWGKVRLASTIGSRTEWCISRQRHWGVPIPGLLCDGCGEAYLTPELVNAVADGVAKEGIEYWDTVTVDDLKEQGAIPKDLSCKCGGTTFTQERDILDVWFDSGVSSYAVLEKDKDLGVPADVYLEGSDQHRGWFQSSLLSSMVLRGHTPTRAIVTHGFTVDEKGHKMSKSLGNTIDPQQIIGKYSVDILRLWVASTDFEGDVVISHNVLKNVSEVYRKIRNTCRFLLSNLSDFDISKDAVSLENLEAIDQYALAKLHAVDEKIRASYERYHLTTVFHTLGNYCSSDLSSFYLDIIKDRLYCEKADGPSRRSAQTVCYQILDSLTRLMAPVLSFMAEELSDYYQFDKSQSIHLQDMVQSVDVWEVLQGTAKVVPQIAHYRGQTGPEVTYRMLKEQQWNYLLQLRDVVLKAIETERAAGKIKHSLEAKVTLHVDEQSGARALFEIGTPKFLKDFMIVSQVVIAQSAEGLQKTDVAWLRVLVQNADGEKCPRCWQYDVTEHEDGLCRRCQATL